MAQNLNEALDILQATRILLPNVGSPKSVPELKVYICAWLRAYCAQNIKGSLMRLFIPYYAKQAKRLGVQASTLLKELAAEKRIVIWQYKDNAQVLYSMEFANEMFEMAKLDVMGRYGKEKTEAEIGQMSSMAFNDLMNIHTMRACNKNEIANSLLDSYVEQWN